MLKKNDLYNFYRKVLE